MTTYQLTDDGYVIKDGVTKVPTTETPAFPNNNPDFLAYRAWLAAGNVPKPAPTPEPAPLALSALAFLDLFTQAEQVAVATAAMADVQAKLWYDRTLAAQFVTLEDPRTEAGLDALVTLGLLTAPRKAQIVAGMVG